jgi:DNA-binding PadR family transcriptional regulator
METKSLGDPALSILMVLAGGRRHGYAIIREAEELSGGRVRLKVSSLYAALDRLASDGLIIRAGDEAVDGRLRRYFALSDAGAQVLRTEADRLATQSRVAKERLDARRAAGFAGGAA